VSFADALASADASIVSVLGDVAFDYIPQHPMPKKIGIRGVFDTVYSREASELLGFESYRATLFCKSADLPEEPESNPRAIIVMGGKNYTVAEAKRDRMSGSISLVLTEA